MYIYIYELWCPPGYMATKIVKTLLKVENT